MHISQPFAVAASFLYAPLRFFKLTAYHIEGSDERDRYSSNTPPAVFDMAGKPIHLATELGKGTVVKAAVDDEGVLTAIQVVEAKYDNPFA